MGSHASEGHMTQPKHSQKEDLKLPLYVGNSVTDIYSLCFSFFADFLKKLV